MNRFIFILLLLVTITSFGQQKNENYNLDNRKILSNSSPKYKCNEEGLVVIQIVVNNLGNVVETKFDKKKSTTNAKCLIEEAEKAAKNTKWNIDSNSPKKQVGTIKYNFSLKD